MADADGLQQIVTESIDLEHMPMEEVFQTLQCTEKGLATDDAQSRAAIFGLNKLEEEKGEIEAVVIATGVHTFFGRAAHLVDTTTHVGHFQKVLKSIGTFCICTIAIGMVVEIIVMYPVQRRAYRNGIDNLLVLLIGGIPIAMPTVLSVTMAIGSHNLSKQGAHHQAEMTAIEEMAGMDGGVDKDDVILYAARASRTENQDAIDTAMVAMLADPMEAREGIEEVHFLPFNPVDKRTALTYIDLSDDFGSLQLYSIHADKGSLCDEQEVPEKCKEGPGGPWEFVGLMALHDPPRSDSAETITRALNLGVNVKMITGDQLPIAKETGRRLGMGTNMYPSSALLGHHKDESTASIPVDELIEKADGFAGVFPEHKYEIVKKLQEMKHICGMTGDGVNDAPALKKADIGIAVADATDAARSASDIVLTQPGLSVIISAVLTSRAIFQRMKNYTIYAVSITVRIVLGFMIIALVWKFDFSPFMVLIIAILNDGTIMTISKDRVKPSPLPDSWKLNEIFTIGVVYGTYMALMTVVFFWAMKSTDFFTRTFNVKSLSGNNDEMMSALYLQVSIISQALIFVTRSRSWSFTERPGCLLCIAFVVAQIVATAIAAFVDLEFAHIRGIGLKWCGVIWLYSLVTYFPLDLFKFAVRYLLAGKAWNNLQNKTAFTTKKNFGKEEREAQWATAQRSLHGLPAAESEMTETGVRNSTARDSSEARDVANEARRRAELARLREQVTFKGGLEVKLMRKCANLDATPSAYTV
ncbi:hypothetical protein PR202_ga27198 [Eleusine coracana subsp. coracana]|uniref:Cation-transporting P-type ATPase N-terminal domain-containing protein n=1 Tax=Eleusine coracana subsp. coracana TaxID=191504 RepID=A0AAV5DFW5_ELECO|nr:hypothetical protein PR202_ga27198 [Eleusine coracana subsp. coracana]